MFKMSVMKSVAAASLVVVLSAGMVGAMPADLRDPGAAVTHRHTVAHRHTVHTGKHARHNYKTTGHAHAKVHVKHHARHAVHASHTKKIATSAHSKTV